uniref:ATP synthase complex subunit 8 n=1 Tax=Roeboides dayi TaxID=71260 RepID=O99427_9TELE|nr:ATPase subunit 8 [Roeboides dayi]
MPQLNPMPWFGILVFSWLIFILVIPSKVLKHTFNYEPTPINTEKSKMSPWDWAWY